MIYDYTFTNFVTQSNKIERIVGVSIDDLKAHRILLGKDALTIRDMMEFVWLVAGAPLRRPGHPDIRVGSHYPPPGGEKVDSALEWLLANATTFQPIHVHDAYMWLHPFMDGNGRSGRALWLWCMLQRDNIAWMSERDILHELYYQHLERLNGTCRDWWSTHGYDFP